MTLASKLIQHSIDAAIIIDERSTIIYANAALAELCGRSLGELGGMSLDCLLPLEFTPEHGAKVADYCRRGGPSPLLGKVREMTLRHYNGEIIPIELKAVDLGQRGGIRHLGAFLVDLRLRKALEKEKLDLIAQLQRQSLTDSLTGLPNRRAFDLEIGRALAHVRRCQSPATVAILDLDRFKRVNDQFGHAAGDRVLQMVAAIAPDRLRGGDFIARVGGEEFGLLFPATPLAQAIVVAERVREAIGAGDEIGVTASIGLTALDPGHGLEVSWRRADMALYRAKRLGRNQVAVY